MEEGSIAHYTRVRQACEPCRRKKTKCTGERPVCSFCQRLNQHCTYEERDLTGRVSREDQSQSRRSRARVRRLESQVEQLLGVVQTLSQGRAENQLLPQGGGSRASSLLLTPSDADIGYSGPNYLRPPQDVIRHFVEVYKTRLHLQPLPLFDINVLPSQIFAAPRFLLHSLLAIGLYFSDHEFFKGERSVAIESYVNSASDIVIKRASEGRSSLEVLQCLSLLALVHIAECNLSRAWMTIGIASRLTMCRGSLITEKPRDDGDSGDDESRCYWSVIILELMFGAGAGISPSFDSDLTRYRYPLSVPKPQLTRGPNMVDAAPLAPGTSDEVKDVGITAYCIQILTIWSHIVSFMRQMRSSTAEDLSALTSPYHRLVSEFYKFEAMYPQTHRFSHVSFENRSSIELVEQREYWTAWILLQVTYHTSRALLNHPILHIVPNRKHKRPQPASFLQQTVDEAILHSGWTVRLFRICDNIGFEINNPFIGHLASVTATVHWIFQFSSEKGIAEKARANLVICQQFLGKTSKQWPHLSRLVQKLEHLQNMVSLLGDTADYRLGPSSELSLYWELLDDSLSIVALNTRIPDSTPTRAQVTTQYLEPLSKSSASHNSRQIAPLQTETQFDDPSVDFIPETLAASLQAETLFSDINLSEFAGLQFPPDFNILGQL